MKTFKEKILELNLSDTDKRDFLRAYCDKESAETLTEFLDIYDEKIDITFNDGGLFKFAMAWEHLEVLKILINYYEKTQLQGLDNESIEYKYAVHKLETIIGDMIEEQTLSDKVLEVVKKYIPHEEVSDTEDDLEDELADLSLQHDQTMHQSEQEYTNIIGSVDK